LSPAAKHTVVEGQAIALMKKLLAFGNVWLVQVDPPSVEARITPLLAASSIPVAKQSLVEGHAMPERSDTPAGSVRLVNVGPPVVVPTNAPLMFPCVPTEKHSLVEGHAMKFKPSTGAV
jgi:hypothetical protein